MVRLPDRQVGTWHAFAYHALGEPELTEAHIKDWNEAHESYRLTYGGAKPGDVLEYAPDQWGEGDRLMLEYSRNRARCVPRPWREALERFAKTWEDWKNQSGYLDFTDLIERAREVERAPGDPSVIFCDEQQDISLVEARLIAHWGQKADRVVLAGDLHQSIYGWRGSDPLAVQEVWHAMQADEREDIVLNQSYRLSRAVHSVALAQMKRCVPIPPVEYHAKDEEGVVYRAGSFSNADSLVKHALTRAGEDESIMFIASCSYMLSALTRTLTELGEPWHNPWRRANNAWNPLETSRGVSFRDRCCAFTRPSRQIWGDEARWWDVADLKAWASQLPVKGILKAGAKAEIANIKNDVSPNILAGKMREWFTPEALAYITQFNLSWYLDVTKQSKSTVGGRLISNMVRRQGPEAIRRPPRIIVGTVHSLKGSEADVVYVCPDLSPAAIREAGADKRVKEELYRVFYVAVTRAKRALTLCQPGTNRSMAL